MINYLHGSPNDFYKFVDGISKDDKIGIITHIDLDGVASAIFLEKILASQDLKINSLTFSGYGKGILSRTFRRTTPNKLFITDFQADSHPEEFSFLKKNCDVFLVDHHPFNEKFKDESNIIKTESSDCSAYCLFDLAKHYLETKQLEWLACSAMITDHSFDKEENFNFIKSIYPDAKKEKIFESEPGQIGRKISRALIYYDSNKKKVYNSILNEDFKKLEKADKIIGEEIDSWVEKFKKEAEHFVEKNLYFYYGSPKHSISNIVASLLSDNYCNGDSVVFATDYLNRKNHIRVSARNDSGKINFGDVLKKCTRGFYNATAGGHPKASGADFPKKYLGEFRENLLREL